MSFDLFMRVVVVICIYIFVGLLWQWAEVLFYGWTSPRLLDNFVALILVISIYFNIK